MYRDWRGPELNEVVQESDGSFVVLGHSAVGQAAKDTALSASVIKPSGKEDALAPLWQLFRNVMLFAESGRRHQQMRYGGETRSLQGSFDPKAVKCYAPLIVEVTNDVLKPYVSSSHRQQSVDLMDVIAPIPIRVIMRLLDIPQRDEDKIREWSATIARAVTDPASVLEIGKLASQHIREIRSYFAEHLRKQEKMPVGERTPVINRFLHARDAGYLSARDSGDPHDVGVLDNMTLVLIAGHETTSKLLGNAFLSLALDPEAAKLCRAAGTENAPGILPDSQLEEILRHSGPVEFALRVATDNTFVGNTQIPKGSKVWIGYGASNRDPLVYGENADQLDLNRFNARGKSRPPRSHVYGTGPHVCLGSNLANLEIRLVLPRLLQVFANPTVGLVNCGSRSSGYTESTGVALRGPDSLVISAYGPSLTPAPGYEQAPVIARELGRQAG